MRTTALIAITTLGLLGCDPELQIEDSPPPVDPIGEHSDPILGPSAPTDGLILLFEDDHDQAIVQPEPEPVLTLQEVSDRARQALAAEDVLVNHCGHSSPMVLHRTGGDDPERGVQPGPRFRRFHWRRLPCLSGPPASRGRWELCGQADPRRM
jgi:hypothetical protein